MKRFMHVFERSVSIGIIVEFCLWLLRILFPSQQFVWSVYHYAHIPSHSIVRFLSLGSYDLMYMVVNIVLIAVLVSPLVIKYHR
jgi:hypothetical protein